MKVEGSINGMDLLNISAISYLLTGNKNKIRSNFIPSEYKMIMSELASMLENKLIKRDEKDVHNDRGEH